MIAVATDKVLNVSLVPFVEGLIHHQKPHTIAQVEELRSVGVVAGANRVATHLLQDFQPPLPDSLRHRGAHTATIMVEAHAFELYASAVQEKTFIRIEDGLAHADGSAVIIH